ATVDGAAVRIALGGSASLPTRELDLKGTAALLSGPNEVAFELPFVVIGPWESATPLPDPSSLIRRSGAAAPLLDAVRDRKTRDAVRSALGPAGGAEAPPGGRRGPPPPPPPARKAPPRLRHFAGSPAPVPARRPTQAAAKIATATTITRMLQIALISGFTPSRTSE